MEEAGPGAQAARASERRYRLLFEASNDAVYLHGLDAARRAHAVRGRQRRGLRLLGYTRDELRGLTPRAVDAAPAPGQLRRVMAELLREGSVTTRASRRTRDGEHVPVEISSSLTEVDGELVVLSISRDIASARARSAVWRSSRCTTSSRGSSTGAVST